MTVVTKIICDGCDEEIDDQMKVISIQIIPPDMPAVSGHYHVEHLPNRFKDEIQDAYDERDRQRAEVEAAEAEQRAKAKAEAERQSDEAAAVAQEG